MTLPVPTSTKPMLAKLQRELPVGEGWLYEPKWDGFRAIVFRDGPDVEVVSRDGRPFNRYFPELLPVLVKALPEDSVVDGEIVIAGPEGLDFDSLQMRIHPAESRVRRLAAEIPTSFVAFDLLAIDGGDLRSSPQSERRRRLSEIVSGDASFAQKKRSSKVLLTPQTDDADEAAAWFELQELGIEGVIAKQHDLTYQPGRRAMVKVKKQRTVDCVVIGYRLSKAGDGIGSLLLGLYDEAGVAHYVGHTSSFKAAERRALLEELQPLRVEGFDGGRSPAGPSRWTGGKDLSWESLEPQLVCEVSVDKLQSGRFRHAATFLRWRTDKTPAECMFDQLS